MKKSEVEVKCMMNPETAAQLLENLAKSFREGKLVVQKDTSFVTLIPGNDIEVELAATSKKGKYKLELEMKWREMEASSEDATPAVVVSCEEPCIEEETPNTADEDEHRDDILFRKF